MSNQKQATETKPNKESRPAREPAATTEVAAESTWFRDPAAASPFDDGDLGSASQAIRLRDPHLQTAQRRAMASRIGRVQGNQHLQRLIGSQRPVRPRTPANGGQRPAISALLTAASLVQRDNGDTAEDADPATQRAREVYEALDGWNNERDAIMALQRTPRGLKTQMQNAFQREYSQDIKCYLKDQLSGDWLVKAFALLRSTNIHEHHTAMALALIPTGTRDADVLRILQGLRPPARQNLERRYNEYFADIGEGSLVNDLKGDLSGWRLEKSLALMHRDLKSADHLYFDSVAITGTHTGSVVNRIQSEWGRGPAQFAAFERDWDQYVRNQASWTTESAWTNMALREAMQSELSGESWELVRAVLDGHRAYQQGVGVDVGPLSEDQLRQREDIELRVADASLDAATTGGYTGIGTNEEQVFRAVQTIQRIWQQRIERARQAHNEQQLRQDQASWDRLRQRLLTIASSEMDPDSADYRRVQLLTLGNLTPADEVYLAGEALDFEKVRTLVTKYWATGKMNELLSQSATPRNDESGTPLRPTFNVNLIVPITHGIGATRVITLAREDEDDAGRGARRLKLELDEGNDDSDLKRGYELLTKNNISASLRSSTIQAFASRNLGGVRGDTPVLKFLNYISARYENSTTCWEFRDLLAPATDAAEMVRRAQGRMRASQTGVLNAVLSPFVSAYEALTGEDTEEVAYESLQRLQFISRQANARPEELQAMMAMTGTQGPAELARLEYTQFRSRLNDLRALKQTIANTLATIVELTVEAVITVVTGGAGAAAFIGSLSAAVAGMVVREALLGQEYDLFSEENARTLAASLAGHAFGAVGRRVGDTVLGPEELRQLSRIRTFLNDAIADGFQQTGQQVATMGLENRLPTAQEIAGRAVSVAGSSLSAGAKAAMTRSLAENAPTLQRLRTNVVASMTQNIASGITDQTGTFVRTGIGNRSWAEIAAALGEKGGQGALKGLTGGTATVGGARVAARRAERAMARAEAEETAGPASSPAQTSRETTEQAPAIQRQAEARHVDSLKVGLRLQRLMHRAQQLAVSQGITVQRKPDEQPQRQRLSPTSTAVSRIPLMVPPRPPATVSQPSEVTVASVIASKSPTLVRRLTDAQIAAASIDDRITLIKQVANQKWVGLLDEWQIERIYRSFEKKAELQGVLQREGGVQLWNDCISKGADLDDFKTIKALKGKFRKDVKYQAKQYLKKNRKHAEHEMAGVGLSPAGSPIGKLTPQQKSRLDEMKAIAKRMRIAQLARDALRQIPVARVRSVSWAYGATGFGGHYVNRASEPVYTIRTQYFHPDFEPINVIQELKTPWRAVKKTHDELTTLIAMFSNRFPTIYALIRDNKLDEMLSAADGAQAQGIVATAMKKLIRNIDETMPKIDPEDLHWEELAPIHAQLFSKAAPSTQGVDWSLALNKWTGNDAVKDYKDAKFWRSLGLGTLAAAAFIVAEIASFGSATFFVAAGLGLGATGLQAGLSWENYQDMAQAADTSVSDQLAIVAKSDVSAALLDAILDSAFGLLDFYGLGKAIRAGRQAAKAFRLVGEAVAEGARRTAIPTMVDLGKLGRREAADLVERSLSDLGIEETIRRTGKSADELANLLAASGTKTQRKAAARIKEYEKAGRTFAAASLGTVEELLPKLASLSRKQADQVVVLALGKYGPRRTLERAGGWKQLVTVLGKKGSKAGSELERWRHHLFLDLEKYIKALPEGDIRRTGTWGFGHDMDLSLLGPRATEYRDYAMSFLAGRAGTSPNKLHNLLYCDVFTDPRRSHIYDVLDAGTRRRVAKEAAAFQDQLVWNQRLFDARKDKYLLARIREQMADLNISEIRGYRPLTGKDKAILARRSDKLHQQLEAAIKVGDKAKQEELVRKIGHIEAQINVAEGGGYFTSGGIRRYASERPGEVKPIPALRGKKLPVLVEEQPGAVHDQIAKLQAAGADLQKATGMMTWSAKPKPAEIAQALKAIGKYGERLESRAVTALGLRLPKKGTLDDITRTFQRLVSETEAGTLTREAAAGLGSDLVRDATRAIALLDEVSTGLLEALRRTAGVKGVKIRAGDIRLYTLLHVRLVRAMQSTFWQLRTTVKLIVQGSFGGGKTGAAKQKPAPVKPVYRQALEGQTEQAHPSQMSPAGGASALTVLAQRQPVVTPLPPPTFGFDKFILGQPRFDAEYTPVGPVPAEGTLDILLKVHIKYQKLTREMRQEKPYKNYTFTSEQKKDMAWKAAEKTSFASDFQSSVRNAWSAKHKFALKDPAFANYRSNVRVKIDVVTDASQAHTRIKALKVPKGAPRFRSYVQGQEAFLDIRDPSKPMTRAGSLTQYVRQVGPFSFDKAKLTPDLQSQIGTIADDLRPLVDPANAYEVLSDRYIARFYGRASSKGRRKYNENLGLRRAAAVGEHLAKEYGKAPGSARRQSKGEEHASDDEKFQRVDVIVEHYPKGTLETEAPKREQNVAAHEAGHMFGLGDEYIEEKPRDPDMLPKFAGDRPTHYGDVKSFVGTDQADELLVRESGSMMAGGSRVAKGHYVYFVKTLNTMTKKKWSVE